MNRQSFLLAATASMWIFATNAHAVELLNASYDVSRELFVDVNSAFAAQWKAKTGEAVDIRQSHGGSSKQARSVIDGLAADVVTLNQTTDIEAIRKAGLIADNWQARLPNAASPYYSLPIFLVRAGNPKRIKDWNDLVRADVQVVFPNPKTSGNGRYSYLAAYAYALDQNRGDAAKANEFVARLLTNVPVFDIGGRGSTTTFVERQIADVLITFEAEVNAIRNEYGKSALEAVIPSLSLRADFPVAVVDKVAAKHGVQKVAAAYLEFLYSEPGQELLAKHHNRVYSKSIAAKHAAEFPAVKLVTIQETFGGWDGVTRDHFADGAILDQALQKASAKH